jgi:hypothetical protein
MSRQFTKDKMLLLCQAYNLDTCSQALKKEKINAELVTCIKQSDKMPNPDGLTALPSKRTGQSGKSGKIKGKSQKVVKCQVCQKEYIDGEQWITCNGCHAWLHRTCGNINDEEWVVLNEVEDNEWMCSECRKKIGKTLYIHTWHWLCFIW